MMSIIRDISYGISVFMVILLIFLGGELLNEVSYQEDIRLQAEKICDSHEGIVEEAWGGTIIKDKIWKCFWDGGECDFHVIESRVVCWERGG